MDEKQMTTLNDGRTTHTNRRIGRESTPDMIFVHSSQQGRYQWEVLEELGESEHKPLLITSEAEGIEEVNTKYAYKWGLKSKGFSDFRETVEEEHPKIYERKKTHKLEKIVHNTITKAANDHIGVKEVSKDARPEITKEINRTIEERNILRRDIKKEVERSRWIDECKKVNNMIRR